MSKPRSAYGLFIDESYEDVKAKILIDEKLGTEDRKSDCEIPVQVLIELSKMWNKMSDEQQKSYHQRYLREIKQYYQNSWDRWY